MVGVYGGRLVGMRRHGEENGTAFSSVVQAYHMYQHNRVQRFTIPSQVGKKRLALVRHALWSRAVAQQ